MSMEMLAAIAGLITALTLFLGAVAGTLTAITAAVKSFRSKDDKPAPEIGIPAPPKHESADRFYEDARNDLELANERIRELELDNRVLRDRLIEGAEHIDEDTQPMT